MKSNKIPRPPNAFILYRKFHHPMIVQQNPGKHNNEISTIIGKMWGNESPEVIAEFKARAEQANAEHALKYPGYQYQPRKPSEKKRRMTKKKAQAASLLSTKKMIKASRDDSKFIQQDEKVTLSFPLNQDSKKHDVVHNADASPIKDIRSADEPDSNAFGFIDPTLFTNITAAPEAPDCTRLDASAPYFSDIEGIFHPSTYENYSAPEPYPENGEPDVLTLISRQMGWIS
ncbi:high mobility group box domain-containing protein [Tricladium varicosporioides]|nr:high mobility group box domain-containing protein [Hymenoscyphus varicosporioides]